MLQSQTEKEASQISKITRGQFQGDVDTRYVHNLNLIRGTIMLDIVPVDNHMTFNINTFRNHHGRFETHHTTTLTPVFQY